MANWQTIDELQDISADLPRFTDALTALAERLGLDIAVLISESGMWELSKRTRRFAQVRWDFTNGSRMTTSLNSIQLFHAMEMLRSNSRVRVRRFWFPKRSIS